MPDFGDVDPTTGRTSARTGFEGTVDPLAPSVANGQISPEQWAEYQAKRRRDALFGTLMTLGGMLGAQPLANAMGIGSGASAAANSGGALPPIAGGAPWSVTPYAGAGMSAGGNLAGAAAGGAGAAKGLLGGMSGRDLAAIGTSLAGTIGGAMSKPPNMSPNTMTQDPQLAKLLATMQGRLDKSEPLIDSIFSMANGLLPTQYQKGGGGMG